MPCTLRCYFLCLLSGFLLSTGNWFYLNKNSTFIVAAGGPFSESVERWQSFVTVRPSWEIIMRQLLLQQTVIYQSFGSSRHIHMSVQRCSRALFYVIPLINAGNRQLLQSFPDPSQTDSVASCPGTLCFVCLFFLKLLTCLFHRSICLSCACSLIGAVIITRRTVPRAFL